MKALKRLFFRQEGDIYNAFSLLREDVCGVELREYSTWQKTESVQDRTCSDGPAVWNPTHQPNSRSVSVARVVISMHAVLLD